MRIFAVEKTTLHSVGVSLSKPQLDHIDRRAATLGISRSEALRQYLSFSIYTFDKLANVNWDRIHAGWIHTQATCDLLLTNEYPDDADRIAGIAVEAVRDARS
ncbi:ribbon-helix-helix domain-containing protein [Sphingomonadaceae bacterium]|nr:ribbon-helix-helix domain-containing protein [Sphingomonadaceae bacterium]